jgi:predicted GNAT family N-acyltransferase
MIQGKLLQYGNNLEEVYSIRRNVFIEELGIPKEIELDDFDDEAIHVLVYEVNSNNKTAVATGRIKYCGESCIIDKVAVLKEYRQKEYGDFTIRMLLNRAFTAGINEVTADVSPEVFGFFEKLGFHKIVDGVSENTKEIKIKINSSDVKTCCKK